MRWCLNRPWSAQSLIPTGSPRVRNLPAILTQEAGHFKCEANVVWQWPDAPSAEHEECLLSSRSVIESSERPTADVGENLSRKSRLKRVAFEFAPGVRRGLNGYGPGIG